MKFDSLTKTLAKKGRNIRCMHYLNIFAINKIPYIDIPCQIWGTSTVSNCVACLTKTIYDK